MSFHSLACTSQDQLGTDYIPSYSERLFALRVKRDKITTTWRSYFAWYTPEYNRLNKEIKQLYQTRDEDLITWLEENKYFEQKGEQFNLFTDIEKTTIMHVSSRQAVGNEIKKIGFGRLDSIYNLYLSPTPEALSHIDERVSLEQRMDAREEATARRRAVAMAVPATGTVYWAGRPIPNPDALHAIEEQREAPFQQQQAEAAAILNNVNPMEASVRLLALNDSVHEWV